MTDADPVNMKLIDFLSRQQMSARDMRKFANMLTMAADLKQQAEDKIEPAPKDQPHD
jgi:hypothetical protein